MRPSSTSPFEPVAESNNGLQLLLFVDKRSSSKTQQRQVEDYISAQQAACDCTLQIIDVELQPYMAEHFKLVATPALIRIYPEPRRSLAGNNLVQQLETCWARWQRDLERSPRAKKVAESTRKSFDQSIELIQLSDELFRVQQETETLQSQLKFKDRIIAMLAHDLRNPLTAVSIALETLESHWQPPEDRLTLLTPEQLARLAHHARSQMQVIERMITNLLDASRGNQSILNLTPQKLDLAALCYQVLANIQGNLAIKAQVLKQDIPSDLPAVYADADYIRQVLVNLLDNAMKYTPAQGTITVSILHRTTQKVQISICDNGPGIPETKQEFIFEEQYRLERDEHQDGYGIGLALCQRIIRGHYGQIWVDSAPEQGSCFHFTLPVYGY